MEGLQVLAKDVLDPLVQCEECEVEELPDLRDATDSDDEDDEPTSSDARTAPATADPQLKELLDICRTPLKSALVNKLVCGGVLADAKKSCVDGDCGACGFQQWWSKGYRKKVVEYEGPNKGKLKADAPAAWRHVLRWERLKKGASKEKPVEGSKEAEASGKEPLRETVRGTAVQLLDEFEERMSKKAVIHRRVRLDTAMAQKQLKQNAWLGMLLSDYDWAENGVLELARQIQSEYWSLISYSLFISITSYLLPSFWKDRTSELKRGAEAHHPLPSPTGPHPLNPHHADCGVCAVQCEQVTVEPVELSTEGAEEPAVGSFYATIDGGSTAEGYSLKDANGNRVAGTFSRAQLRHRKWHTIAFAGFTNEKRHDGASSQHMINWQLKNFWAPRARAAAAVRTAADADMPPAAADAADEEPPAASASPVAATAPAAVATAPPAAEQPAPAAAAGAAAVPAVRATVPSPQITDRRFQQWLLQQDMVEFWAWVGHSDNATHFKSGKMFHYWSTLSRDIEFVKTVWINFGCPGHGKGAWDGFGAVVKTKVPAPAAPRLARGPSLNTPPSFPKGSICNSRN
jgi:hypothetical protein